MLKRWMGRTAPQQPVTAKTLAGLAPFLHCDPTELATSAALADRIQVGPGLLKQESREGRLLFLEKGSVQIQTQNGFMLLLKAGTPQATYPLPDPGRVASRYAQEPCSFISLPGSIDESPDDNHLPPAGLQLSAEESRALQEIAAYLRTGSQNLPTLPDLALKIGKTIDAPQTSNEDVARLIQFDPVLSTRVLSVVNSAAFGGLNKISSIHQAVARLGRNKVRNLVYSFLLKNMFRINSNTLKRHMEALWSHAAHVAALSFILGRVTPGIDPEQALLAGLVHDIGAVAVIGAISRFPVLERREEVLQHTIASLRREAGIRTLEHWGLADELQDVVKHAGDWQRMGSAIAENPDVVILAQLHALIGTPRQADLPRIDQLPAFFKLANGELTPHHSLRILDKADAEVREVRAMINAD